MDSLDQVLSRLASAKSWGYHADAHNATEPAALAAVALLAHGRDTEALPALDWLVGLQGDNGSIGISAEQSSPGWPTGWAVMAWQAAARSSIAQPRYRLAIARALPWMLSVKGSYIEYID